MTNKITHNGKEYEVGKIYRGDDGRIGYLQKFRQYGDFILRSCDDANKAGWQTSSLREVCKLEIGTITDAPRQDGWYMCKWEEQIGSEDFIHPEQPFKSKDGVLLSAPVDMPFFEVLYKMERAK